MELLAVFVFFFFVLGLLAGLGVVYLAAVNLFEQRQDKKQEFQA